MKIGHPYDYYVQVFPDSWDQDPAEAALYEGIFTLGLNVVVSVRFIPDVRPAGPPWPSEPAVDPNAALSTPLQARAYEVLTSELSVTPNDELAGQVAQIGDNLVFYVTAAEFQTYETELSELTAVASGTIPSVRRADVLDRAVMRFVDTTVLDEPRVHARHGEQVGR